MSPPQSPLHDVRVAELSTGIPGGYAAKLFADAGADVVKVEPPDGDPLRRWSASGADLNGRDGALFQFLATGKRSVVGTLDDPQAIQLVADADVVIESFPVGVVEEYDLMARFPGVVVVSISPYGRDGPWADPDRPSTEFTLQAECGSTAARGERDSTPLQVGGRVAEWAGGVVAAPAALAALRQARRTGQTVHVDVSLLEAMALSTNLFADLANSLIGRPDRSPSRWVELPSIEPTADGWVGFNTNTAQQFQDFLVLIERPDLLDDSELRTFPGRMARRAEWDAAVHAWTTRHTTEEVIERASLLRIPVAPVGHGRVVLDQEHLVAREAFATAPGGGFRHPVPPYKLDGVRPVVRGAAPALGANTGTVERRTRAIPADAPATAEGELPFAGLRVADLTCWWAGPACTQFLAGLGADVIHVESVQKPDGMRLAGAANFYGQDQWWEYSSFFLSINVNKRGVTLDLTRPEGVQLAHRLIEWADVVVENFTPRVVEQFGLDWDAVHAINPRAVMVRMPAFGLDGPWRNRVGFAQTVEQMSGLAWVTGYRGGPPLIPRGPCDPLGGLHAAFALQLALMKRDETGEGVLVEAPLIESALNLAAEQVIECTAYGTVLERDGNRSPGVAPQGLYACAGTEQWLALSVATDEQWDRLKAALGKPAWADDPALATTAGRRAAHDRLDDELAAWARDRELEPTVELLLAHGVPAAAVVDTRSISTQPQLAGGGFIESCTHPVVGTHPVMTLPFRFTGVDAWIRTPAPTLGQHNREVLRDIVGLQDDEIDRLEADAIIGTRFGT